MKTKKLLFVFLFILLLPLVSCGKKSYDVSDDYFELISYDITEYRQVLGYDATIRGKTIWSVFEIGGEVNCFNEKNEYLGSTTFHRTMDIEKNGSFFININLDYVVNGTKRMDVEFYGKSHSKPMSPYGYNVTLVNNNNTPNVMFVSNFGKPISKPSNPTKEGYIFDCWCTDKELTNEYDFSKKIKNNTTLYAKYIIDYSSLTDLINDTVMKSNVTIITSHSNRTSSFSVQGSGVIFSQKNGRYYVLTNNHVVEKKSGYNTRTISVEDCYGNEYAATLRQTSADYDIAFLIFEKKSNVELNTLSVRLKNPNIGDDIVVLSQPHGRRCTISFGKISNIGNAPVLRDGTQLKTDVITSSAKIAPGSSGGAVFDKGLKLIGLNYAGSTDSGDNFVQGYAIPIETINKFLTEEAGFVIE